MTDETPLATLPAETRVGSLTLATGRRERLTEFYTWKFTEQEGEITLLDPSETMLRIAVGAGK